MYVESLSILLYNKEPSRAFLKSIHFLYDFKRFYVILQLTLYPPNYSTWIFTHLKLCLADAIHNFKWVKIIQIWQNRGQLFQILLVDVTLPYFKCGT